MLRLVKLLCLFIILFIGILIFIKSLDYYDPDLNKGFLANKEQVFDGFFKYGLYAHIVSTSFILFIGTYQAWVRPTRSIKLHMLLGKLYTVLVLFLAAPGGLILSFYASGGLIGKASFLLLSFLWAAFTWKGYVYGKRNQKKQHMQYMIRSYVLTVSAIFLRLLLFAIIHSFHSMEDTTYGIVAWLSWLPALVFIEIYFRINEKGVNVSSKD